MSDGEFQVGSGNDYTAKALREAERQVKLFRADIVGLHKKYKLIERRLQKLEARKEFVPAFAGQGESTAERKKVRFEDALVAGCKPKKPLLCYGGLVPKVVAEEE